jgi:hypothetical protein
MKTLLYRRPLWALGVIGFVLQGSLLRASDSNDGVVTLGDLKSRVPADWVEEVPYGPNIYRQYRLDPIDQDKEYTRVSVYSLGTEKATAADHVKRWEGSFLPPEGRSMNEAVKLRKLTANGTTVTWLDIRGDYKGIPGDRASPRGNFRMVAVYFDTPRGAYAITLFGPADTVGFYRKGFEDWVKAFK